MRKGQKQTQEAKDKISKAKKGKKFTMIHRLNISYGMKLYHRLKNNKNVFDLENNYALV